MIRVTITPRNGGKVFRLLSQKEQDLRRENRGTLHRSGKRKAGEMKWVHSNYHGWIRIQDCLGGIAVALIQSKAEGADNRLLSSFIGFVDRHFSEAVASVTIAYDSESE
ncbi:MAG TPA: hypothetical protein VF170_20695 [Planctomycetaceae bacterium]